MLRMMGKRVGKSHLGRGQTSSVGDCELEVVSEHFWVRSYKQFSWSRGTGQNSVQMHVSQSKGKGLVPKSPNETGSGKESFSCFHLCFALFSKTWSYAGLSVLYEGQSVFLWYSCFGHRLLGFHLNIILLRIQVDIIKSKCMCLSKGGGIISPKHFSHQINHLSIPYRFAQGGSW